MIRKGRQKSLLVVTGNTSRDSGQAVVNEEVIAIGLQGNRYAQRVVRGRSRGITGQISLLVRLLVTTILYRPAAVYYAPSRSSGGILRDLLVYHVSLLSVKHVVVHWHGSDLAIYGNSHGVIVKAANRILSRANHICLCNQQRREVEQLWPDTITHVVENAPSAGFIESVARVATRKANEGQPRQRVVSFLSGVRHEKGIDKFLALAKLCEVLPVEFRVYGPLMGADGKVEHDSDWLQHMSGTNVRYCGPVYDDDKAVALLDTDVLVFPSRQEAMPLVVLEGLCAGCLVLTSGVGYLRELNFGDRLQHVGSGDVDAQHYRDKLLPFLDSDAERGLEASLETFRARRREFEQAIQAIFGSVLNE